MGRPQNFVRRALSMRTCLTYFVSTGAGIAGIAFSSSILTTSSLAGSIQSSRGVLSRFPGARLHCCPSPRSIGSFTTCPSARRKVS
jgi:hypothetical protein